MLVIEVGEFIVLLEEILVMYVIECVYIDLHQIEHLLLYLNNGRY